MLSTSHLEKSNASSISVPLECEEELYRLIDDTIELKESIHEITKDEYCLYLSAKGDDLSDIYKNLIIIQSYTSKLANILEPKLTSSTPENFDNPPSYLEKKTDQLAQNIQLELGSILLELEEKKNLVDLLSVELEVLKKDNEELKVQKNREISIEGELKEVIDIKNNEIQSFMQEKNNLELKIKTIQDDLKKQNTEKINIEHNFENKIKLLNEQSKSRDLVGKDQIKKLLIKNSENIDTIDNLQLEIKEKDEIIKDQKNQLKKLDGKIIESEVKLDDHANNISKKNAKIDKQNDQIKKIKNDLKEKELKIRNLSDELGEQKNQNDNIINDLKKENNGLKKIQTELMENNTALIENQKNILDENKLLHEKIRKLEAEIEESRKKQKTDGSPSTNSTILTSSMGFFQSPDKEPVASQEEKFYVVRDPLKVNNDLDLFYISEQDIVKNNQDFKFKEKGVGLPVGSKGKVPSEVFSNLIGYTKDNKFTPLIISKTEREQNRIKKMDIPKKGIFYLYKDNFQFCYVKSRHENKKTLPEVMEIYNNFIKSELYNSASTFDQNFEALFNQLAPKNSKYNQFH